MTTLYRYLKEGVNFGYPDYDGRTALHLAVCGGKEIVLISIFILSNISSINSAITPTQYTQILHSRSRLYRIFQTGWKEKNQLVGSDRIICNQLRSWSDSYPLTVLANNPPGENVIIQWGLDVTQFTPLLHLLNLLCYSNPSILNLLRYYSYTLSIYLVSPLTKSTSLFHSLNPPRYSTH